MTERTPQIPEMVPSAEERVKIAQQEAFRFGWERILPDYFIVTYRDGINAARAEIAAAERRGERRGLDRAVEIARDRLERTRNHGPNIEAGQDTLGYDYYRAGSLVASEVIMNTIRALAQGATDE